jgi:hypothetical protein
MKSASLFVVLVFSLMVVALASIMVEPAAAEDPIIVGKWDRTDGADVYTIYADHLTKTVFSNQTHYGTWEYDGTGGYQYIFHWEHSPPGKAPFIDYVTVAADGQSYSGHNNYGNQFNCIRLSYETDSVPAEDSGFPIVPVAVGGGIAAAAIVGAAAYWYFIAGKTAEAAAESAEATAGSLAVNEKTKEVAFDVTRSPTCPLGSYRDISQGLCEDSKQGDKDLDLQETKHDRLKLQERIRDQTTKTEQQIHQNRTNTQKKVNEQMQQELKDTSHATQEVADSGENSSSAEA